MNKTPFPVIDLVATGNNIRRLRVERGLSVRDLQRFFGFEEPRAVYKWQKGETLPSVDNLYALGILLGVPMESILVRRQAHSPAYKEQQEKSCCSDFFGRFGYGGGWGQVNRFFAGVVRYATDHGSDDACWFDHRDRERSPEETV